MPRLCRATAVLGGSTRSDEGPRRFGRSTFPIAREITPPDATAIRTFAQNRHEIIVFIMMRSVHIMMRKASIMMWKVLIMMERARTMMRGPHIMMETTHTMMHTLPIMMHTRRTMMQRAAIGMKPAHRWNATTRRRLARCHPDSESRATRPLS